MTALPPSSDAPSQSLSLGGQPSALGALEASRAAAPPDSLQLADYFRIIRRNWRLVSWAVLGGCLAGLLVTWLQTPLFRARTTIEIQNINADFLNTKQARPVSDDSQGTDALVDLQTQIEILQSEVLVQSTKQAIEQSGIKRAYSAKPSGLRRLLHTDDTGSAGMSRVLDSVAASLKVSQVKQTRIVQLQVDAPNPILAADFANTLIAEYKDHTIRARLQMTEAAEDWTRSQLADMKAKLKTSEAALQSYASEHQLVFTSQRQNISDDRLRQVQSDLLHARADLAEKAARSGVANSASADSLPDVARDTDLRELRVKLIDLRRQEAELITIYKPDYSEVRKVRAQVEELQTAIDRERQRILNRIVNEYSESSQREKLLTGAYDQAVHSSATESQAAIQYDILKRELDANVNAYQEMLAKVRELGIAAAIRTSNVRVVDSANPPQRPNSPKMPLNLALGIFSGLMLGVGLVLLQDRSNHSLRHPGEARMRIGVPELAVIPTITESAGDVRTLRLYKSATALEDGVSIFGGTDLESYPPTTDDFRGLLTSIVLSGENGNPPKLVVITSAAAQDGKTTVASHLAIAAARSGRRVLLVDGDLRNPQIHKLFGLQNIIGLCNLLEGNGGLRAAAQAPLSTTVERLSVLTGGSFASGSPDRLFESQLHVLLGYYRESYDLVVVDSPPMLRIPDARLLGRSADGVVLVARSNRTNREAILTVCQRLALDRSRVLGIVLNDWKGETSPYPYPS
jgi:polysaccharide biosynthesis transport protein